MIYAKCIPNAEDGHRLFAKEKGLIILHLQLMMLPLTMNRIILKHVGLQKPASPQYTVFIVDKEPDKKPKQHEIAENSGPSPCIEFRRLNFTMYSTVMKGSLTATSSTSSLCRATLATNLPILPNPNFPFPPTPNRF